MRLSSEADEPLPMEDPRVQSDPAYLTVIILARVVTRLGSMPTVDTDVIEKLEPADLAYLQERYDHIHQRRGGAPGDS